MARKTQSEVVIERLHRQQKSLKERIDQSRIVADGVNSSFWKVYRKMMADKLSNLENELFGTFKTISNEQVRCLLTSIVDVRMFIAGPSDFEKSIEFMEEKLEKIKVEIDERKSK